MDMVTNIRGGFGLKKSDAFAVVATINEAIYLRNNKMKTNVLSSLLILKNVYIAHKIIFAQLFIIMIK